MVCKCPWCFQLHVTNFKVEQGLGNHKYKSVKLSDLVAFFFFRFPSVGDVMFCVLSWRICIEVLRLIPLTFFVCSFKNFLACVFYYRAILGRPIRNQYKFWMSNKHYNESKKQVLTQRYASVPSETLHLMMKISECVLFYVKGDA